MVIPFFLLCSLLSTGEVAALVQAVVLEQAPAPRGKETRPLQLFYGKSGREFSENDPAEQRFSVTFPEGRQLLLQSLGSKSAHNVRIIAMWPNVRQAFLFFENLCDEIHSPHTAHAIKRRRLCA